MQRMSSLRRLALTGALSLCLATGLSTAASAATPTVPELAQRAIATQQHAAQDGAADRQLQMSVSDRLLPGTSLNDGQALTSSNGQHYLKVGDTSTDTAVEVDGESCGFVPLTEASPSANGTGKLAMQADGNLVYYANGVPTWATGTWGNPGSSVVMQTDGNVVVYSAKGAPLWASDSICSAVAGVPAAPGFPAVTSYLRANWYMTSPDGGYKLVMQGDGNLVLYSRTRAIWSTNTWGNPDAFFAEQSDGNMVVYSKAGKALWNSGTRVRAKDQMALLIVQPDGNLVQYALTAKKNDFTLKSIWTSHTRGVN